MKPSALDLALALGLALACGRGGEPPVLRVVVTGPMDERVPEEAVDVLRDRAMALGAEVFYQEEDGSVVIGFPASSGGDVAEPLLRRDSFSLWLVDERATDGLIAATSEAGLRELAGGAPLVQGADGVGGPLVLAPPPVLTAMDVEDATVVRSETGQPRVSLVFREAGAARFADATNAHVGERFAIVADGKYVSAPRIHEPITGGKAVIEMGGTADAERDARELAAVLDSGELPVPLEIREVSTW